MTKKQVISSQSGFTFIEIIVASVILGLLATAMAYGVPKYFQKRRDVTRKFDVNQMKRAFEDYASDHTCYPAANLVQDCDSNALEPYLKRVPCDPKTELPYEYVLSVDCRSYELYTTLENTDDQDIVDSGCQNGCGPSRDQNYGVVGGGAVLDR